jgi:hypothetical protein
MEGRGRGLEHPLGWSVAANARGLNWIAPPARTLGSVVVAGDRDPVRAAWPRGRSSCHGPGRRGVHEGSIDKVMAPDRVTFPFSLRASIRAAHRAATARGARARDRRRLNGFLRWRAPSRFAGFGKAQLVERRDGVGEPSFVDALLAIAALAAGDWAARGAQTKDDPETCLRVMRDLQPPRAPAMTTRSYSSSVSRFVLVRPFRSRLLWQPRGSKERLVLAAAAHVQVTLTTDQAIASRVVVQPPHTAAADPSEVRHSPLG